MAGKTDRTAVQYAFKKLSGRANTSNIKSDAQEVIGSNIQAGTQTIFGQDIPLSASRTDYQLYSASNGGDATAEYVVFTVAAITGTTYDADSATGGGGDGSQSSGVHGYKLFLTGNYQALSSNTKKGSYPFVNGQLVHWTLGKLQLIPPNFSQESPNPYILKIFEADSSDPHQIGDEIPLLDEVDWTFDYYNGILFLQDYDASKIPAFAKGFIYVGDYLSASLSNATGTPGGSNTQVQFNDGGSFGGDSGFTYNKSTDTMTVSNMSGSLTRLSDGTSYLTAGSNVTITSASNGQVSIAAATGITEVSEDTSPALGGQLTTGDHKISYAAGNNTSEIDFTYNGGGNFTAIASVKSIDMFLDLNGGDAGQQFRIFNNLQPASSYAGGTNTDANAIFRVREEGNVFTKGYVTASMGFSGSLTKLTDGTSYLAAGTNVTITSASNGQVTISSTAPGTPGGSDTQLQFNDGGSFGGISGATTDGSAVTFGDSGILVGQDITHAGDADTKIVFADDAIGITVGGEQLLTVSEAGTDMVTVGDGGDVDFRVRTENDDNTLYIEGSTDRIGIGTNSPSSIVHIKESAPTLTFQRENNSNASTIDFLGALGNTANSIIHDSSTNDLVFKTFNGTTVEEIMRIGDHYGSTNRQVIFLSGSAMHGGAMHPRNCSDIAFFVSGSINSIGTSVKGASVFGGDLVVSGALDAKQGIGTLKTATTVLHISASTAPSSGSVLVAKSSTEAAWQQPWIFNETPAGALNGSNKTFSLAAAPINGTDLMLYLNGLYMASGSALDYTLTGTIVNFAEAPLSGDVIRANYRPSQ